MDLGLIPRLGRCCWRSLRAGSWVYHPRTVLIMRMWAVLAVPVLLWVLVGYGQEGLTNGAGKVIGEDFVDFWTGARFAVAGQGASAYDLEIFRAAIRDLAGAPIEPYLYSYPPSFMLLTVPLAALPFGLALALWTLGGGGALFFLLKPMLGARNAWFALLAAPATFVNALFGQTGVLTAIFLGGGLVLLGDAPVVAGLLLGMLSFKPHLGILVPVALVCGGHWRAFFAAVVSVLGLALGSVVSIGVEAWLAFPDRMRMMQEVVSTHGPGLWHRIPTTYISARLLGVAPAWAWAGQALVALMALAAVIKVWRRPQVLPSVKAATLVLATFLTTPYAWDYDLVVLVVVVAWRFKEGGWQPWEGTALILVLLLPFVLAPAAKGLGLPMGPLVLAFALWAGTRTDIPIQHDQLA